MAINMILFAKITERVILRFSIDIDNAFCLEDGDILFL